MAIIRMEYQDTTTSGIKWYHHRIYWDKKTLVRKCHKVFDRKKRLCSSYSAHPNQSRTDFSRLRLFDFARFLSQKIEKQGTLYCSSRALCKCKSKNSFFIRKFESKSNFCSFFSIPQYQNRPEMTSSRNVQYSHNSMNSRNFRPQKFDDSDITYKNPIHNFKIHIRKNNFQKFHANRTSHSRVIAYVLFLEHLQYF